MYGCHYCHLIICLGHTLSKSVVLVSSTAILLRYVYCLIGFYDQTPNQKKGHFSVSFFVSNAWLKITLQRQRLDLYILRLRSPSSQACLGTCQHSQDDGYGNLHSTHVPIHHKSIRLLDYVQVGYQR